MIYIIFRTYFLPPAEQKTPVTLNELPILLLPMALVSAHAFLNLRSAPRSVQLALLPVTILTTFQVNASHAMTYPYLIVYNVRHQNGIEDIVLKAWSSNYWG